MEKIFVVESNVCLADKLEFLLASGYEKLHKLLFGNDIIWIIACIQV